MVSVAAMSEDASFLRRWALRKAGIQSAPAPVADSATVVPPEPDRPVAAAEPVAPAAGVAHAPVLPPLDTLGPDSDYRPFLVRGVDRAVRTQALRTLFHQPEYNVIDPLGDYLDDYTVFAPLGDAMTADLRHRLEVETGTAASRLAGDGPLAADAAATGAGAGADLAALPAVPVPPPAGRMPAEPGIDIPAPAVGAIPSGATVPESDDRV